MKSQICSSILILFLAGNLNAAEGVILLHGLCRSSSSMKKMEKSLRHAGFEVKNISYPSRTNNVKELSELVIGQVLKNNELEKWSKIHFVTHSLGGILVRSYLKKNTVSKLGRVVMLGPPNQGSEVTDKLGSWWLYQKLNGPAGIELGTGDDSTPNQLGPVNFELGIIAGDRSINWINSLMIKGPDDGKISIERTKVEGMKDHIVLHSIHPYLMKNKKAIKQTIHFLKTGAFKD